MDAIRATGVSDVGRQRETNEDCFAILDDLQLYLVSDGMGGHAAGEIASQKVVEFVAEALRTDLPQLLKSRNQPGGYFRILEAAEEAVQAASQRIYHLARTSPGLAGMGATLTLLMIVDNKAVMSHVGDSRLYLLRDGQVHLLSTDHTLAQELLAAGGLTAEEAKHSRLQHALTRAMGQQEAVDVETLLFDTIPGDTFLLCSDGLSKHIEDSQEIARLLSSQDLDHLGGELVELANQRGGSDNITAVVARVDGDLTDADAPEVAECLHLLQQTALLRGLPLSRLMRVLNIAELNHWKSGEVVVPSGAPLKGMHYVLSGALVAGRRELQQGDTFGEPALLRPYPSPVTVRAAEETRTLYIPGRRFDQLARRLPRLGRRLMRRLATLLSQRLIEAEELAADPLPDTGPWKTYD